MELLRRFIDSSRTVEVFLVDEDGRVVTANPAFRKHVGLEGVKGPYGSIDELLLDPGILRFQTWIRDGELPTDPVRMTFRDHRGAPYAMSCLLQRRDGRLQVIAEPDTAGEQGAADRMVQLNNELVTIARERARQKREMERTRDKLSAALEDLRNSYWHLQKIQEVLPLCMRCGRVKTSEATWQSVIDYLKENAIFLSHGYCPGCSREVEKEFDAYDGHR